MTLLETSLAGYIPGAGGLIKFLDEIQGWSINLVSGAAADTDIALADIATEDTIKFVMYMQDTTASYSDVTANTTIITAAKTKATHTGNVAGPFAITAGANDQINVTTDEETVTSITLTAGTARTVLQVCDDIEDGMSGDSVECEETDDHYLKISSATEGAASSLTLAAGTHDACATLGLTAATYTGAAAREGIQVSVGTANGVLLVIWYNQDNA